MAQFKTIYYDYKILNTTQYRYIYVHWISIITKIWHLSLLFLHRTIEVLIVTSKTLSLGPAIMI